jgi:hypothetical protein
VSNTQEMTGKVGFPMRFLHPISPNNSEGGDFEGVSICRNSNKHDIGDVLRHAGRLIMPEC